ncbi:3-deoxy-D-manno-octulosonic acid kinase [Marinicella litoralis]|nr:3-deoxy-D-manno-octulosonic acid kinase [Marinicella litoralis]
MSTPEISEHVNVNWFKQDYWLNLGRLLGANSGRGTAWTIKSEWGKWVLRHYLRGGLYAKINRDSYLWTGLNNTRAVKEFTLLNQLQEMGLPSPKPIAAMVIKKGLFYQNDLIMENILHDQTFAQALLKTNDNEMWRNIGHTIAKFHANGIYHSDLNAHNILLMKNKVYLIDFDKGDIRRTHAGWQKNNLLRLKRSIEKVTQQSCDHALKNQWQILMDGYHA